MNQLLLAAMKDSLATSSLAYTYAGGTHLTFPDISLAPGQHLLVTGPSGCGKSTLLQLLSGLKSPTSGSVNLGNTSLHTLNSGKRDSFRRKHIGLVLQRPALLVGLSVYENLKLIHQLAKQQPDLTELERCIDLLEIRGILNHNPTAISEGELQRCAIAAAVSHKPKYIFADEPTSALDNERCSKVIGLLKATADEFNSELVVVTHDERLMVKFSNTLKL